MRGDPVLTLPDTWLGFCLDELLDHLDSAIADLLRSATERIDDDQLDLVARLCLLLDAVTEPLEMRLLTRGNKRDCDLHGDGWIDRRIPRTADNRVSPRKQFMSSTPNETTTRSPSIAIPAANSMPLLGANFIG